MKALNEEQLKKYETISGIVLVISFILSRL